MSFRLIPYSILLSLLLSFELIAQPFKVLHYSETSGFDHNTRQSSLAMLRQLGTQHNFTVDDDQTGNAFNTLSNLQQYSVVIFANTSGSQLLDSAQRANFKAYMLGGGAILGIHAASDTYRHSSANGANTGAWDWYAETLGGSVQQNPNHTAANHNGTIEHLASHPTTRQIPNPWNKVEEYYYWENGYLNTNNINVLQVLSTGSTSYDTTRPVSWYRHLPGGGRSFYTSLGHANSNYTSDTSFQNHIRDAVLWTAGRFMSVADAGHTAISLYPNPSRETLHLQLPLTQNFNRYQILNMQGEIVQTGEIEPNTANTSLSVRPLPVGNYLLQLIATDYKAKPISFIRYSE